MPPEPEQPPIPAQKSNTVIKVIRIILAVLIVVGIALLCTQRYWVPGLVDVILKNDKSVSTPPPSQNIQTAVIEGSFTASSTNPDFQTYTDSKLGFSIDVPKVAYAGISGCTYNASRPSYEFTMGTTSVPLQVITRGNTTYIDFAYYYDLVQAAPSSPNYSQCVKSEMATYLPLYEDDWHTFSATQPISIAIYEATSTANAEAVVLQAYNENWKGVAGYVDCSNIQAVATTNNLTELIPCSHIRGKIFYSPIMGKVAYIIDGPHEYCPFSKDGAPGYQSAPGCYNPVIDNSFRFLSTVAQGGTANSVTLPITKDVALKLVEAQPEVTLWLTKFPGPNHTNPATGDQAVTEIEEEDGTSYTVWVYDLVHDPVADHADTFGRWKVDKQTGTVVQIQLNK